MLLVKGKDLADILKGLIDSLVFGGFALFRSDEFPREIAFREAMSGIMD